MLIVYRVFVYGEEVKAFAQLRQAMDYFLDKPELIDNSDIRRRYGSFVNDKWGPREIRAHCRAAGKKNRSQYRMDF